MALSDPAGNISELEKATPAKVAPAPPSPIQLFKQQYPGYAKSSDEGVYKFLSNPANFKKAFPGYAQTPDEHITSWLQQFNPASPQLHETFTSPSGGKIPGQEISPEFQGPLPQGYQRIETQKLSPYDMPEKGQAVVKFATPLPGAIPGGKAKPAEGMADKVADKIEAAMPSLPKWLGQTPAGADIGVLGLKSLSDLAGRVSGDAPKTLQAIAGLAQVPNDVAKGLMTPENYALMAGMYFMPQATIPALAHKLMAFGMSGSQAIGAARQFKAGLDAYHSGDIKTATRLFGGAGVGALIAGLAGAEFFKRTWKPEAPEPVEKVVKGEVVEKKPLTPEPKTAVSEVLIKREPRKVPEPQTSKQQIEQIRTEQQSEALKPQAKETSPTISDAEYRKAISKAQQELKGIDRDYRTLEPPQRAIADRRKEDLRENIGLWEEALQKRGVSTKVPSPAELKAQAPQPLVAPRQVQPTAIKPPSPQETTFYPDAEAAAQLQKLEREQEQKISDSKIAGLTTEINKINHTLERSGRGRVAETNKLQQDFLQRERVKLSRQLKDAQLAAARRLSPQERAKQLIAYSGEAEAKTKMGQALLAAAKEKEAAPAWLNMYAEGVRTKNPEVRGTVLATKLKELKAGIQTPEDLAAVQQVEKYMTTLYEAEQRLGRSIPLSTSLAHLRHLGERFTREGEFAQRMSNALQYRLGAKREKAAIAKEEVAPKAAEEPKPIEAPVVVAPEPKPSYEPEIVPKEPVVEKPPTKEILTKTEAEEEAAEAKLPTSRKGGAVSLDVLTEKGREAKAKELTPEETILKEEQEAKLASLTKNLERSSLRDAFKADMLKGVEKAGGDVAAADHALDSMPLDKMLELPWPKEVREVIDRYAERAAPAKVQKTIEITPTDQLSEKGKELLKVINFFEDGMVHPDEFAQIRRAIPKEWPADTKLARYAEALQKYVEWDEDQDPKALRKAINFASKSSEKGAVTVGGPKYDPLVLMKKARAAGWEVGFTASSKVPDAAWISPAGENQVWVKVDLYTSHEQMANEMLETKPTHAEIKRAQTDMRFRRQILERNMQAMNNLLKDGWIRKASKNSYELWRYTPEHLNNILEDFKRDLYELRQTNDDPALFIEANTDLKGRPIPEGERGVATWEIATTWNEINDKYKGDLYKIAAKQIGKYSRDNAPSLYSGFPIHKGWPYIKRLGQLAKEWALNDLNGGQVSNGFLRGQYYGKIAQASINEIQGLTARETHVLHHQLGAYEKLFDSLPADKLRDEALNFYRAHSQQQKFTNPQMEEASNLLRALTDDRYNQITAAGQNLHYLQNYFPGIWEKTKTSGKVFKDWANGKALFDTKAKRFFKPKKYLSFDDAIAAGLEPVSWNPIKQYMQYLESMDRYLVNLKTQNFWKDQGFLKFAKNDNVRKLPPMPEGMEWAEVKHPAMTATYRTPAGQKVMAGKWYAVRPFADAINRYMAPGWNKNLLYQGVRMYSNYFNLFKLGVSAFHAMMTTVSAASFDFAYGMNAFLDAFKNMPKTAGGVPYPHLDRVGQGLLRTTGSLTLLAPVVNDMFKSAKLYDEYLTRGSHPELTEIVDRITKTNAPWKWPGYYYQPDIKVMMDNWAKFSLDKPIYGLKAAAHLFPAIIRYISSPIMDKLVPYAKIASLAKGIEMDIWRESQANPRTFTAEQRMLRAMDIAHAHDEAFGEMQLENRNWPRAVKELLKVAFISGGWNAGTYELHKGGVLDFAKEPFKAAKGYGFEMPIRAGFLIGMSMIIALWSALIQWGSMKKLPQSAKDLYAPQVPGKDSEGNQNRVWIKSYLNDDVNFLYDPKRTAFNKASGPLMEAYQLMTNRDWEGYQIYNPQEAPWQFKNLGNITYWALMNKTPLSIQNFERERGLHSGLPAQLEAFVGVQPAPLHVRNDALENRILSVLQTQFSVGPRTFEEKAGAEKLRAYRIQKSAGKLTDEGVAQLVRSGFLTPEQGKKLVMRTDDTNLINNFKKLTMPQMLWAWQVATGGEKNMLAEALAKKASNLQDWSIKESASPAEATQTRIKLEKQLQSALAGHPLEQIEAQVYMKAGQEKLDWGVQHFMEQPLAHLKGMPTFKELIGIPWGKSRGENIAIANELNRVDTLMTQAQQRGDKETVQEMLNTRREILMEWKRDQLKRNPRGDYRHPLQLKEGGVY